MTCWTEITSRLRRDEGAAGMLEAAILAVVMVAFLVAPTQIWLVSHARNVASGAAQVAAVNARGQNPQSDARAAAAHYLSQQSGLNDAQVSVTRGTQVTVTVTGHAPSMLLGIPLPPIRQTATMPVDRETMP